MIDAVIYACLLSGFDALADILLSNVLLNIVWKWIQGLISHRPKIFHVLGLLGWWQIRLHDGFTDLPA